MGQTMPKVVGGCQETKKSINPKPYGWPFWNPKTWGFWKGRDGLRGRADRCLVLFFFPVHGVHCCVSFFVVFFWVLWWCWFEWFERFWDGFDEASLVLVAEVYFSGLINWFDSYILLVWSFMCRSLLLFVTRLQFFFVVVRSWIFYGFSSLPSLKHEPLCSLIYLFRNRKIERSYVYLL